MASKLPKFMRAAQWTPKGDAGIEELIYVGDQTNLPERATTLPRDSTLVRVEYSSINPVDYKLGEVKAMQAFAMGRPPFIPACDLAGTVVETNLPQFKPGDRVFGSNPYLVFSTCAEYVVVTGRNRLAKVPDGVSLSDAATLDVAGLTAYQSIVPYAQKGSRVLINGASGGVGTFAIQIAKAVGCSVTAVCSTNSIDLVKSLGADDVIDYRKGKLVNQLIDSGKQYDLIVDAVDVGGPLFSHAHRYSPPTAKYVSLAGDLSFSVTAEVLKTLLLPKWLGGGKRSAVYVARKESVENLDMLAKWVAEGKITPSIEKIYELDEIADAFTRLKSGHARGKLVVKVAGPP